MNTPASVRSFVAVFAASGFLALTVLLIGGSLAAEDEDVDETVEAVAPEEEGDEVSAAEPEEPTPEPTPTPTPEPTPTSQPTPTPEPEVEVEEGMPFQATQVSVGASHGCAILADGAGVACWENSSTGGEEWQPGTAERVPGLEGTTAVSVGSAYACAVNSDANLRCWSFQDGLEEPIAVEPDDGSVVDVAVGDGVSCAIASGRTAGCWVHGQALQSRSPLVNASGPAPVPNIAEIAVSSGVVCVVTGNGQSCGSTGTMPDQPVSFFAIAGFQQADSLQLGGGIGCAVEGAIEVRCWDAAFESGAGSEEQRSSFGVTLPDGWSSVDDLTLGPGHLCITVAAADIHCVETAEVRSALTAETDVAEPVWSSISGTVDVVDFSAGTDAVCFILGSTSEAPGQVTCWRPNEGEEPIQQPVVIPEAADEDADGDEDAPGGVAGAAGQSEDGTEPGDGGDPEPDEDQAERPSAEADDNGGGD